MERMLAYTRPSFDGLALEVQWSCRTRVQRYHPKERWGFWFAWGVRRPGQWNHSRQGWVSCPAKGAFLFNPYVHLRVLGLFIGAGLSIANWVKLDKDGNVLTLTAGESGRLESR